MNVDHPDGGTQPRRRFIPRKSVRLMRIERKMDEHFRALDRTNGQDDTGHTLMDDFHAIPTDYKKCKFRSRLEARYAIFFDCLGVEWEYEKESFDLGKPYGLYLPDFYLPQVDMWAEVKGVFNEFEIEKSCALANHIKKEVLLLEGCPASKNYWAYRYEGHWSDGDKGGYFVDKVIDGDKLYHLSERRMYSDGWLSEYPDRVEIKDQWVEAAAKVAKYARFDSGEDPLAMRPEFLRLHIEKAQRRGGRFSA